MVKWRSALDSDKNGMFRLLCMKLILTSHFCMRFFITAKPGRCRFLETGGAVTETELADQARQAEIAGIVSAYETAIDQQVECLADGKTYFMDGREESAVKMKHGIELAELTGGESMDIVDYYNRVHEGDALAQCYEIMLQQAAYLLTGPQNQRRDQWYWVHKNEKIKVGPPRWMR